MRPTPRNLKLGDLESSVMDVLWEQDEASVETVRQKLSSRRPLAYTTVLTVLSRLHEKGLVRRRKEGRAHVYSAALDRDDVGVPVLESLVTRLFGGSRSRAIAQLLRSDEEIPDDELRRLEALIQERRSKQDGS